MQYHVLQVSHGITWYHAKVCHNLLGCEILVNSARLHLARVNAVLEGAKVAAAAAGISVEQPST